MRLTIAGAVMAALLHSLSSGVAIYYDLSQDLAFWYAGGVAGVKGTLEIFSPYYSYNDYFRDNAREIYFTHINGR